MREIKFRMWTGQRYIYDQNIVFDCMRQQYSGLYDHVKLHESDFEQFTGLHDKNGKEIYEGDIVLKITDWNNEIKYYYEVVYHIDGFKQKDKFGDIDLWYDWDEGLEVIGNIHENPELIK